MTRFLHSRLTAVPGSPESTLRPLAIPSHSSDRTYSTGSGDEAGRNVQLIRATEVPQRYQAPDSSGIEITVTPERENYSLELE